MVFCVIRHRILELLGEFPWTLSMADMLIFGCLFPGCLLEDVPPRMSSMKRFDSSDAIKGWDRMMYPYFAHLFRGVSSDETALHNVEMMHLWKRGILAEYFNFSSCIAMTVAFRFSPCQDLAKVLLALDQRQFRGKWFSPRQVGRCFWSNFLHRLSISLFSSGKEASFIWLYPELNVGEAVMQNLLRRIRSPEVLRLNDGV